MSVISDERAWITRLREQGAKAAHPDDGWVDRERNRIHLTYPQFDDGVRVGDLLALGWPTGPTRMVRVVDTSDNVFAVPNDRAWYLHFEEAA